MADMIPFVALFVIGVVMAQAFGRKIEEAMPCSILMVISILFIAGVFGHLAGGLYIIGGCTIIGGIIVFAKKKWRFGLVFTPGGLFLLLLLLVAMLYHRYRIVTDWDELGQWALSPKNMYLLNVIPNSENSNIIYTDYPPASAIWCYFWTKVMGKFRDSSLYVAMMFFNVGILAPVLKNYSWKDWKKYIPAFAMLLIAPRAFNNIAWTMLMIDYLLGALTVYIFYVYYTGKNETFDWLQIAAALFVLIQVKSTGMFFACVAMAFIVWDLYRSSEPAKKKWIWIVTFAITLVVSKRLWSYFLSANELDRVWNLGELTLSRINVFSTNNGVEGWHRTAFANCFRAILNYNISENAVFYIGQQKVPLIAWFIIVALLSWCVFVAYKKEPKMRRAYTIWIVANIIFTLSVAYLYYLEMSESECNTLSAYSRYVSTVVSAIWMFGVVMLIEHLNRVSWNRYMLIGIVGICLLPSWSFGEFALSKNANDERIAQYQERMALEEEALLLQEYVEGKSTIVFNGQTYVFNYLAAPVKFSAPLGLHVFTELPDFLNFVPYNNRVYFSAEQPDIYTEEFKIENARHFWAGGDDVTQVIKPYTLYRVLYDANRNVVLEYVGQIKEE